MYDTKLTANQKQQLKDQIITQLFHHPELRRKIESACWRNFIHREAYLHEDILQETLYHVCRKSPDYLIDLWTDGGRKPEGDIKRLVGLAIRIAIWKGLSKSVSNRNYPKHSIFTYLSHTSNLFKLQSLSPTESFDEEGGEFNNILVDPSTLEPDEDPDESLWKLIRSNLNEEELATLDHHLNLKKGPGRFGADVKAKYDHLLQRIEEIIIDNKIKI